MLSHLEKPKHDTSKAESIKRPCYKKTCQKDKLIKKKNSTAK